MAYSKEQKESVIDKVCIGLMEGKTTKQICSASGMPSRGTVYSWLLDNEDFQNRIARARTAQADTLDDEIQEVIDKIASGVMDATAGRTVIWGMQWRAAKMRPKKYGEYKREETDSKVEVIIKKEGIDL